jgi:outer membrane protein OmpA-like peptidoglycan-associated protein
MKKIYLFLLLISSTLVSFSQVSINYLDIGNTFYRKGDYRSAIHYFEKFLSPYYEDFNNSYTPYSAAIQQKEIKQTDNAIVVDAIYKTGDSYRRLFIHDKAAGYFKEVLKRKVTKYPLVKFYYATELKLLGQFEESKKMIEVFLAEYKKNDDFKKQAQNALTGLDFITGELAKKDIKYFTIKPMVFERRDTGAHYGPVFLTDSTLLLNSTRANYELTKNIHQNRVFGGIIKGESIFRYLPVVSLQQDGIDNQAVGSVSEDGKEIYLTKWSYSSGKKISSIYIAKKTASGWTTPLSITELNDTTSSTQQPFLAKVNGKKVLFFSSDRKGGLGGYDLYSSELTEKGTFGKPVNLGSLINTEFDEVAPYFHSYSQLLIFANNGRIGMGGFDLYSTSYPALSNCIKNLGYPINSIKDDLYFTSRSTTDELTKDCWVSSDRFLQCCLQTLHIVNRKPDYEITGRVINCDNQQPLKNVEVLFSDSTGSMPKYTAISSEDGSYRVKVSKLESLTVSYKLKNFISKLSTIAPSKGEEFVLQATENCLVPLVEKKSIVLEKIYFEYNKADLLAESQAQLDSLVAILNDNPGMSIQIDAHTDSVGSEKYNLDLSSARAKSVVSYLIEKGIKNDRLSSRGYGESMPLEPNSNPDGTDNPAGRARNRRCAFTILKLN